jgi:hypothetical protein
MSVFRLWIGDEDYGTAAERQAKMWLAYHKQVYPNEPARIEEVADDAPMFIKDVFRGERVSDDGPRVFPPLAPGHPAIWEPCGLCGATFVAGDVTLLIPRERWTPGSGMTFEGALVHQRCYKMAMRVPRKPS